MKRPLDRARRRRGRGGLAIVALAGLLLATPSRQARAWDPSTTHQGLLEAAVTRSALHLRWMDASELERGLFSELRVDPDRLEPAERRLLQLAMRNGHADAGAQPLGGPGACPRAEAPVETQLYCVSGDLWEHSALGWLRLGMVAEVTPSARHTHHFLNGEQPEATSWRDEELSATVLRARQARSNGEPLSGVATRTNFDGDSPSAIAWLEDPDDLLAPATTFAHLEQASTATDAAEREHHLALALVGVGALLHVVQDLSVPAHARGDATAFFSQLSPAPGDRGLPLQEFVRVEYGRRDIPGIDRDPAPPTGLPLAATIRGHLFGDPDHRGVAELAGRHFFSESSLPAPAFLEDTLGPAEAAAALLGSEHGLDPAEVEGAVLAPWPAGRGYLLSPTGRALAAFDTDLQGRIRPYLDETCYREQAAVLLPAAVDASRSLLDLIWPEWPAMRAAGSEIQLELPADWRDAELLVFVEDPRGQRRAAGSHALTAGEAPNALSLATGELAEGERVVLVLRATREQGPPIVLERLLSDMDTFVEPEPTVDLDAQPEPAPIQPQPL